MDWDTILFPGFLSWTGGCFKYRRFWKILADLANNFLGSCSSPVLVYGILCLLTLYLKQLYHQLYCNPDRASHWFLHWNRYGIKSYDSLPWHLFCSQSCLL